MAALNEPVVEIDITRDICPITFVRTRLALDRLPSGGLLRVRLRGQESRTNVPRTAAEQGHAVLDVSEEDGDVWVVLIRRA